MPRKNIPTTPLFSAMDERAQAFSENRDCAVKAVAIATGATYDDVLARMAAAGRKKNCGTYHHVSTAVLNQFGYRSTKRVHTSNLIWRLENEHNYKVKWLTTRQLAMFPDLLDPAKTYLISTSGHVACYKAGELHDWSNARALRILSIHEVEKV